MRSLPVHVDAHVLENMERGRADRVLFSLFDDVQLVGVVDRAGSPRDGTTSWSGHFADGQLGGLTMVARDGNVSLFVWGLPGGEYGVVFSNGRHWVRQVNPDQSGFCDADDAEAVPENDGAGGSRDDRDNDVDLYDLADLLGACGSASIDCPGGLTGAVPSTCTTSRGAGRYGANATAVR